MEKCSGQTGPAGLGSTALGQVRKFDIRMCYRMLDQATVTSNCVNTKGARKICNVRLPSIVTLQFQAMRT